MPCSWTAGPVKIPFGEHGRVLQETMPTNCWTSTWHKLECRMAENARSFEQVFACYVARLRMCVSLYSSCFFSFSWAPQFRTCSKQLGSNIDLLLSTQNFGKLGGRCWRATAVGIACGRLHLFLHALNVHACAINVSIIPSSRRELSSTVPKK